MLDLEGPCTLIPEDRPFCQVFNFVMLRIVWRFDWRSVLFQKYARFHELRFGWLPHHPATMQYFSGIPSQRMPLGLINVEQISRFDSHLTSLCIPILHEYYIPITLRMHAWFCKQVLYSNVQLREYYSVAKVALGVTQVIQESMSCVPPVPKFYHSWGSCGTGEAQEACCYRFCGS